MGEEGASVDQLDASQARLLDTIEQVKRCCQPNASHELLARATAILAQRLEAYVEREHMRFAPMRSRVREALRATAADGDAGIDAILRDLRALWGAWRLLPACSLAAHITRLADELQARLARAGGTSDESDLV